MQTNGQSGGGQKTSSVNAILTVVVVLVLLVFALGVLEIYALDNEVATLQQQNSNQQLWLQDLQNQLNSLEFRILATQTTTTQIPAYSLEAIGPACLSFTPDCGPDYVYIIEVENSGSQPFPVGSSVFLFFNDTSRLTNFGFNSTLGRALAPNFILSLNSTSWPQGVSSKLAPGDVVEIGITIANVNTGAKATVLTCSNTTTTFLNYTQTQTATSHHCT